ncbi:MtnX-like HAD-IB family phosphatase [Acinetobacter larvae]|uniref:Phosphatase n=1 Tax=Acinetobacter larvae TaxID=1789224 RepID=A0A1B2LX64_9GAMM|nr:MtnX-like HAD-IB family phosphatase [Acinetobacter larvae]AOA57538.1 phosphatase [Acinetobacter larvae]
MPFYCQTFNPNLPSHIICDFDGTISLKDTTDYLLSCYGKDGWIEIEQQWEQGLIGSQSCMQQQVALLDMSVQQFHHCLDQIHIDAGFIDFAQSAAEAGIRLSIVSDGLDLAIHYILKKHQLSHIPVTANQLSQRTERTWQLDFPNQNSHCLAQSGTCKCKFTHNNNSHNILLIGDGRSDFCIAEQADYVFAKKSLIQHCQDKNIQHLAFEHFSDLMPALSQLIQHQSASVIPSRLVIA